MSVTPKEAANYALELAIKKGCQSARISLNINTQSSYSVRNDKLDRLQQATGSSLYIQLFVNERYGSFSTNRIELSELDPFITKGIEATKLLAKDPLRSLPPKELYYIMKSGQEMEQYDASFLKLQPKDKSDLAFACAQEIYGTDKRIVSINSEYGDSDDYFYMLDSQGFIGETHQTNFTLSAECSVKGRGDSRPEAWWFDSSMFFDKLQKEGCGRTALERAINRLNPKKLKSGKYNMVIENTSSSRVISPIISALNGASIQQNNSFLKDSLGKQIFSNKMQLFDDAHRQNASGSRYFDGEGLATKPFKIIEDGVINAYFINSYYSKKLEIPITIEGPSVLTLPTPNANDIIDLESILKSCGNGIFVTEFNGGNCNSSTGDFSFGIQGYYFENGVILYPIKEMNVTGNIIELWNNLAFTGNDARNTSRWLIPTLAFESVSFSGI